MSKEYDLGRVVGRDATINGQNAIQLIAGGNIKIEQDGENVTIGVDGKVEQSGTADKLSTPRKIKTNLSSSDNDNFDGTSDVSPGVDGVLPIVNGGTGASTAESARDNLGVTVAINTAADETKQWATGMFSNPNILINGDFQIWQRGTSFDLNIEGYTADRWLNYPVNDTNAVISRVSNTSPAPAEYALKIVCGGNNGGFWLTQPVENYSIYEGKTLTMSFYIRGVDGFTGLISAIIGTMSHAVNVTEEWQYITITKENVTFDTEDISRQGILFVTRSGNIPTIGQGIELACVKLELTSEATPFVPKNYGEELAACQRYFISLNPYKVLNLQPAAVGTGHGQALFNVRNFIVPLPQTMRITPTLQWKGKWNLSNMGSSNAVTDITLMAPLSSTINSVVISATATNQLTANMPYTLWGYNDKTADITLDAEIY